MGAESYYNKGDFSSAISALGGIDTLLDSDFEQWVEGSILLGHVFFISGRVSDALKRFELVEQKSLQRNYRLGVFLSFIYRAHTVLLARNLNEAMGFFKRAEELFYNLENLKFCSCKKQHFGLFFRVKGLFYLYQGDYKHAIEMFDRSLEFLQDDACDLERSTVFNNLGVVFYEMGNYDSSLQYHVNALNIREKYGNKLYSGLSKVNVADVMFIRESYELAERYYLDGIADLESIDAVPLFIGRGYYRLLRNYLALDKVDAAKKYLVKLKRLVRNAKESITETEGLSLLAEARILLKERRLNSFVRAQELLSTIIKKPYYSSPLLTEAYFLYLNTKIIEVRVTGSPKVLEEVDQITDELISFAEKNNIRIGLAKVLFLRAQLDFILRRFSSAQERLLKAWRIVILLDYSPLEEKIRELLDKVAVISEKRETGAINEDGLVADIFDTELVSLEGTLRQFLWNTQISPAEAKDDPFMFVIVQEHSGNMVYSYNFRTTSGSESLISGLLAAINLFAKKVFKESSIEVMKYNKYSVLMLNRDELVFAYAFSGSSLSGKKKLIRVMDLILGDKALKEYLLRPVFKTNSRLDMKIDNLVSRVFYLKK